MDTNQQNQKPLDKKALDQAALEQFVDTLIQDRKDPGAKPEVVKPILLKQLNEAINTQLINALSEKDQVVLDEFLDKNPTDDELNTFFMENIPNLEAEIASALLSFRAAYLYKIPDSNGSVPPPPPPAPVMVSDLVN